MISLLYKFGGIMEVIPTTMKLSIGRLIEVAGIERKYTVLAITDISKEQKNELGFN